MHFIHLDHFNTGSRADGPNGIAMCLDPVVDGNMAAFQEPANGTKTKPFKVKLERLPLSGRTYPPSILTVCLYPQDLHLYRCLSLTIPSLPQSVEPHFGQFILAFTPTNWVSVANAILI